MAGASLRVGANTSEFTSQMKSMLTQMKLVTSEYKVEAAQAKALGSQTDLLKAKKTELTTEMHLLHLAVLIVIAVAYTLILTRTLPKKQQEHTNDRF